MSVTETDPAPRADPAASSLASPVPWGWVVFLFALLTGLFTIFILSRTSIISSGFDPYGFGLMGLSIAKGHGFADTYVLFERKAPLYPGFIGGVYALLGVHPEVVLLLQCLMYAGSCVLVYDIGQRLFNKRTGVIAGLMFACYPLSLRYVPYLQLETLLTLLFTLVIWLTLRFKDKPTVGIGVLIGVASGLASLTKSVVLLYPVLFAIGIILVARKARKRGERGRTPWVALAAIFVALGVTLLPWTIRMYRSEGHVVLISTGTSDAYLRGYIFSKWQYITLEKPPYTDAENQSDAYFRALAAKDGAVWQKNDYQTDKILNAAAEKRFVSNPLSEARKTFVGLFTFWYELTDLKNSLVAFVCAAAAGALAIVGWRRARREHRAAWLVLLPIIFLNIEIALLLALGRYSVPVLPELCVAAAFGVDTLLNRWAPTGLAGWSQRAMPDPTPIP